MSRLSRFVNQWRRRSLDREFDAELRFHIDSRVERNVGLGMTHDEAVAEARRHLGSTLRAMEGMRDARITAFLDTLARDLRHGWRLFSRQPGLACLAVLTLSLGIGANATIFFLLNGVLLRPLPIPEPDHLVSIRNGSRALGTGTTPSSTIPELLDLRARTRTLAGVSWIDVRDFQIDGGTEPARVLGARVESTLLSLVGMPPQLGRVFSATEGNPGSARVVVLSDAFWRRTFGADPSVVNRAIVVNGEPATVIGVMPRRFPLDLLSPEEIDLFVPYPMIPAYTSRSAEFSSVRRVAGIARLRSGVTRDAAAAELRTFATALAAEHPALYQRGSDRQSVGFYMDVEPLRESLVSSSRPTLFLLFGAVGLVLLIACLNTAQFLLARMAEREGELALRTALGASRVRLVRQFLAESLLLAVAAAIAGVLQAVWLLRLLRAFLPARTPVIGALDLDTTVLAFTAGVALVTALGCALVPALRGSRPDPVRSLESRGAAAPRLRSRQAMIAAEVALSVVLLVAAGLLVRTILDLQSAVGGFDAENTTVMRMRNATVGGGVGQAYQQYLAAVRRVPGVASAAMSSGLLATGPEIGFTIPGRAADATTVGRQQAAYVIASPGYFSTLRIPLVAGRDLAETDAAGRPPVAVINEAMARQVWPGADPIGQRVDVGPGPRSAALTVVGVAGNVRPVLQDAEVPQIYVSYLQQSEPSMALLVRGERGDPPADAVKRAIWSVQPRQAVFGIRPLTEIAASPLQHQRTIATLLGSFAVLAVVMSLGGIYTVVSYLTARRTREIALRRAIGARASDVMVLLAGQTFRWTTAGIVLGVLGAVAASRSLRAIVAGVVPLDAVTVGLVCGAYLLVVAFAMSVPALRALRVDPASALRAE